MTSAGKDVGEGLSGGERQVTSTGGWVRFAVRYQGAARDLGEVRGGKVEQGGGCVPSHSCGNVRLVKVG